MYTFIDEAGDFAVPADRTAHRVAVSAGVTFTDRGWSTVQPQYQTFRSSLTRGELDQGEPKWHLLTPIHRRAFCQLLHRDFGVSVTPVTLDLSHLVGRQSDWLDRFLDRLEAQAPLMHYESAKEEIELLCRQARNLSPVQHLRIYSWAYCIHQAFFHAILFLGHGPDGESWERITIEIDAVQRAVGNREDQVFRLMLMAWLAGWSTRHPFLTIQGIHTADHPLIRRYDTADGIEISKLIRPNLHFRVSAESDGLQIADLVAGVIYEASDTLGNDQSALDFYSMLMNNASYYGPVRGPGLFSPFEEPLDEVAAKYDILADVVRRAAG